MGTSFMIGLALAGMALLLGIAIVMQRIEERRKLHARKVRDLGVRIRKYWAALTELPPGFLTPALQMILVRGLSGDLKALEALQPGSQEVRQYSAQLKELMPRIRDNQQGQEKPVLNDEKTVRETRARLRSLHQLVQSLAESRQLEPAAVNQFLAHINQMNGETLIALYMLQARNAVTESKPAVAVHMLDLCMAELEKINQRGNWHPRIEELRAAQANLEQFGAFSQEEALALQNAQPAQPAQPAHTADDDQLSAQLQEMMEEEESWKKKAEYD